MIDCEENLNEKMGSTGALFYTRDSFMGWLVLSYRKGRFFCANVWYTIFVEQSTILLCWHKQLLFSLQIKKDGRCCF